jgi:hypothetical protein
LRAATVAETGVQHYLVAWTSRAIARTLLEIRLLGDGTVQCRCTAFTSTRTCVDSEASRIASTRLREERGIEEWATTSTCGSVGNSKRWWASRRQTVTSTSGWVEAGDGPRDTLVASTLGQATFTRTRSRIELEGGREILTQDRGQLLGRDASSGGAGTGALNLIDDDLRGRTAWAVTLASVWESHFWCLTIQDTVWTLTLASARVHDEPNRIL